MTNERDCGVLAEEARHLVKLNQSEVPSIVRSYIFHDPSDQEIRVIHVDSKFFPESSITPIQFTADPKNRLFHRMLIAIIDVEGPNRLIPPLNWGNWEDARIIDRPSRKKAS